MTPKLAVIAVQTTTPLSLSTVPSNAVANTATARRLNPAKSHCTLRLERTTSTHTRPPATSAANPQRVRDARTDGDRLPADQAAGVSVEDALHEAAQVSAPTWASKPVEPRQGPYQDNAPNASQQRSDPPCAAAGKAEKQPRHRRAEGQAAAQIGSHARPGVAEDHPNPDPHGQDGPASGSPSALQKVPNQNQSRAGVQGKGQVAEAVPATPVQRPRVQQGRLLQHPAGCSVDAQHSHKQAGCDDGYRHAPAPGCGAGGRGQDGCRWHEHQAQGKPRRGCAVPGGRTRKRGGCGQGQQHPRPGPPPAGSAPSPTHHDTCPREGHDHSQSDIPDRQAGRHGGEIPQVVALTRRPERGRPHPEGSTVSHGGTPTSRLAELQERGVQVRQCDDAGPSGAGRGEPAHRSGPKLVDGLHSYGTGGRLLSDPATISVRLGRSARSRTTAAASAPASTSVSGHEVRPPLARKWVSVSKWSSDPSARAAEIAPPGPTAATQPVVEAARTPSMTPCWAAALCTADHCKGLPSRRAGVQGLVNSDGTTAPMVAHAAAGQELDALVPIDSAPKWVAIRESPARALSIPTSCWPTKPTMTTCEVDGVSGEDAVCSE